MTNVDYLYNRDVAKNFVGKNFFVDRKLHFRIIERGTVLPHKHLFAGGKWLWGRGGIVNGRGEFVKESFVYSGVGAAYKPTEVAQDSSTVIYLGLFYPVWGHVITDNIRRVWFLQSDVFRTYFKNCRIVYVSWGDGDIKTHLPFKRLLELLEVDVDRLQRITRPTRFENIILPDESFFAAEGDFRKFTAEYRETIERLRNFALKNRTPSAKKIYYLYGTRQVGEERLAEYFRGKGYEILSPENLTLDEQLNVLINAESFASTLGSCSHNSIFLRDGAETIFIPRIFNQSLSYQTSLDQMHMSNANYVDSSLSIFNSEHGFYCYILSERLKKFFGDNFSGYGDDDFRIFLRYAKYLMGKGFGIRSDAEKYYGEVLTDFLAQLKRREDLLTAYGVNIS